jgi:hypothetical protein
VEAQNGNIESTRGKVMEPALIALSKTYPFIDLWYNWTIRYGDELSRRTNLGYGFRGGVFYPNGARYGQHHDDWPPFFDSMAATGVPYTGIGALFCYLKCFV